MALSDKTFSSAGGAVNDIFAGFGAQTKAKGDRLEAENYTAGAKQADLNSEFTKQSTEIGTAAADRSIFKAVGGQASDIAGSGFANSGTALDLLRDSAAQGSLTKSVLEFQGAVTEEGYQQQAQSLRTMAEAANVAAEGEDTAAKGAFISAGIKGITALATLAIPAPVPE